MAVPRDRWGMVGGERGSRVVVSWTVRILGPDAGSNPGLAESLLLCFGMCLQAMSMWVVS